MPISVFQSLVAGSISGMAATLACHPLDVIRTGIQLNPNQSPTALIKSTFSGGFKMLYKGVTAPLLAQAFYKSIIFASNNASSKYLFSSPTPFSVFMNGAIAGSINSMVVAPVEIIRTRQILLGNSYQPSSMMDVMKDIYGRNGPKGFYISFFPTVLRDGPGMGFYMLAFDQTKKFLMNTFYSNEKEVKSIPIWVRLFSGAFSGIAFWTWALPIDTIKTTIEASIAKEFSFQIAAQHFRANMHNFYRALPVAYLRGIPSAAVTLTVYELVIEQFQK